MPNFFYGRRPAAIFCKTGKPAAFLRLHMLYQLHMTKRVYSTRRTLFLLLWGLPCTALWQACSPKIMEKGKASFYADRFAGRRTASGEVFRQRKRTAAHRTLPFGTRVRVKNLKNGKTVKVRINDRGPFAEGRIIDLSKKAARRLGMTEEGVVPVELRYRKHKAQRR